MRFIIVGLLLCAAILGGLLYRECGRLCFAPDQSLFNSENPFGYSWDSFDNVGQSFLQDHPLSCYELIAKFDTVLTGDERRRLNDNCRRDRIHNVFPPKDQLPPALRNGNIGAIIKGDDEVISLSYSFLHEVIPLTMQRISRSRRKFHAAVIRRTLYTRYGSPIADGRFIGGVSLEISNDGPCEYWRKEDVAITLCTERIILIDGIEMSLTFTRLDRSEFDQNFACTVEPEHAVYCNRDAVEPTSRNIVGAMNNLANWLKPRDTQCSSDTTRPLETVATLSTDDQLRLAPVLEEYEVEALAWYAINTYNEARREGADDILGVPADQAVAYLLVYAAMQDSPTAMNEVGNMLLTCSLGIEQDIVSGRNWIDKAAAAGNADALESSAFMRLSGLLKSDNPREESVTILKKCAAADQDVDPHEYECSEILSDLSLLLEGAAE